MAKLESKLVVSLQNKVSRNAREVERSIDGIHAAADRQARAMADARGRMFDAVAMGYVTYQALSRPIGAAIAFEAKLEDIRQKADLTRGAITELGKEARQVGLDTAQGAANISGAIDTLIGSGAVTPEQAIVVAEPLGMAATAYDAVPTEMAEATAALIGNLGIAAAEMEHAYDIMAQGGKEGKFELRDMAKEFPAVTAAAKALGIQGTKGLADLVALLEVAATGAASGATAANNMSNYMQKIMAPDSIKKLGAAGVDIVAEMNAAVAAGQSPMERSLEILNELTEGGKQELIGQFFSDKQVQEFIRPLMTGMDEYRRIRDEAFAADGVVSRDFQERLNTPGGAITRFEASIENLNIALGTALLPALTDFIQSVTPMIDSVSSFVDANNKLVAAVVEITAALIGLRLLAATGGYLKAFMGMGGGLPGLGGGRGSGARGAAGGARGVGGGGANLGGLGMVGLISGIGVASDMAAFQDAVRADGGQAWLAARDANDKAMNDWLREVDVGGFKPFAAYESLVKAVHGGDEVVEKARPAAEALADLRHEIARVKEEIVGIPPPAFDGAMDTAAPLRTNLARLEGELAMLEASAAESGANIGDGLQNGISLRLPAVAAEMANLMQRLRVLAGAGVNIPLRVTGPQTRVFDTSLPHFAKGGAFSPGWAVVGEEGPEIVRFGASGFVHTARDTAGMLAGREGRIGGPSTISIHMGGVTVQGVADPQRAVDLMFSQLEERVNDALDGIHADIEFAG
ncbi:phage tail tape measure protein [Devosia sp.]|uniref:phage tail tape measure protein n=1 Tax=Devosia sp. TaxID=1871048 RepID=UPI00273334EB|nr:phage tail tape measure protein [Devosia sp.]MDP2779839.1 phage tail tape measure protein [Devosia sp.]